MSQLHAVRGCVPDNDHSPSNLSGVVHRAAFNQMRSDIGKECSHTYLCGPSNETIAFLDHARDANIATAIPRPAASCQNVDGTLDGE